MLKIECRSIIVITSSWLATSASRCAEKNAMTTPAVAKTAERQFTDNDGVAR